MRRGRLLRPFANVAQGLGVVLGLAALTEPRFVWPAIGLVGVGLAAGVVERLRRPE